MSISVILRSVVMMLLDIEGFPLFAQFFFSIIRKKYFSCGLSIVNGKRHRVLIYGIEKPRANAKHTLSTIVGQI